MNENRDLFWYYQSSSWVIIRGAWFFDFMCEVTKQVAAQPRDKNMTADAQKAYNNALSRHHPWMIQKIVNIALNAIAYRENFEQDMIKE